MRDASIGSQPTACVVSSNTLVPVRAAAASKVSTSSTVPSADWTADTATNAVRSVSASAISASGISVTARPRAQNGNVTLVNSLAALITSAPAGRDAAIWPAKTLTCGPTATTA